MKYFAYGSNMFQQRLKKRVPSANFISIAVLSGYTLKFHKQSQDNSGKCNILETNNPKDTVYGVIFEFDSLERGNLDESEGLGRGYHEECVELLSNGDNIKAVTFIADANFIDDSLTPYTWYKDFVVEGAKQNLLPLEYIAFLESFTAQSDPDKAREARNRKILKS